MPGSNRRRTAGSSAAAVRGLPAMLPRSLAGRGVVLDWSAVLAAAQHQYRCPAPGDAIPVIRSGRSNPRVRWQREMRMIKEFTEPLQLPDDGTLDRSPTCKHP